MPVYLRDAIDLHYLLFRPFVAFEKSEDEEKKIEIHIQGNERIIKVSIEKLSVLMFIFFNLNAKSCFFLV